MICRLKYFVVLLLCGIMTATCTHYEEDIVESRLPSVELDGSGRYISTFYLEPLWDFSERTPDGDKHHIKLLFYPMTHRIEEYCFDATLVEGESHRIQLSVDASLSGDMVNDRYVMRGYTSDGEPLEHEFMLTVSDRIVVESRQLIMYDFSEIAKEEYGSDITKEEIIEKLGTGDKENPYRIFNAAMYNQMMIYLLNDTESHGRGKYFKQIRDIDLSEITDSVDDEGWSGVEFAGNYDGGDKSLTGFSHIGNSSKSTTNVGLFSVLHTGAEISNVTINGSISQAGTNVGILAGSMAKDAIVKVTNCTVKGSIANCGKDKSSGDEVARAGGLIGYMDDGELTLSGVTSGVHLTNSGDCVGGFIGECLYGSIVASSLSADKFVIDAQNCVGGVIGYLNGASLSVSLSSMAVTTTENDVVVVEGEECVGGIVGKMTGHKSLDISTSEFVYPINGSNYVGGAIGYMHGDATANFKGTTISSNIKASGEYAGGFVGLFKGSETDTMATLHFSGTNWFCVAHQNKTGVLGDKYAGGVAGVMGDADGDAQITFDDGAELKITSTITATTACAGGVVGEMRRGYLHIDNLVMHESTNNVISAVNAPQYAGGIAGYVYDECSIESSQTFSFGRDDVQSVPSLSSIAAADIVVEVSGTEYIGGAVGYLKDMTGLRKCHINAAVTGVNYVGGAVGYAAGLKDGPRACQIYNVVTSGEVTGSGAYIGGVVGYITGYVALADCINYAHVDNGDNKGVKIGGVVGYSRYNSDYGGMPNIYYCVNTGDIEGCNTVGGVLGAGYASLSDYHSTIMVDRCANFGNITGSSNSEAGGYTGFGGIMGTSDNTQGFTLASCANHGDIYVTCSAHGVGGIVGAIGNDPPDPEMSEKYNFHIWSCANHGDISGSSSGFHCGGIAGYMEEGSSVKGNHACVEGCYNWGDIDVDVDGSHGLGGLAGYLDRYSELWWNINFAVLTGYDGSDNTGRVWGKCKGSYTITSNYYAVTSSTDGHAFNTNDMGNMSIFGDLDINGDDSFWVMSDGDPHPQIKVCPFQNTTYTK